MARICWSSLSQELGKLPNKLAIEGHTDSKPYSANGQLYQLGISADRANAARRLMQVNGIRADQVTQVRGFADQRLRKTDAPLDPINRRVSLIVQYLVKPPSDDDAAESRRRRRALKEKDPKASPGSRRQPPHPRQLLPRPSLKA